MGSRHCGRDGQHVGRVIRMAGPLPSLEITSATHSTANGARVNCRGGRTKRQRWQAESTAIKYLRMNLRLKQESEKNERYGGVKAMINEVPVQYTRTLSTP